MKDKAIEELGFVIVVLDRGFVYVGDAEIHVPENRDMGSRMVIRQCRNIRVWGTDKGLGQIAVSGPTAKTILDEVGTVVAPMSSVVHWMICLKKF